jgi:hypothetical protein
MVLLNLQYLWYSRVGADVFGNDEGGGTSTRAAGYIGN